MTRHLVSCARRKEAIATANSGKGTKAKGKAQTIYHLRVQNAYDSSFWLNIEMAGSRTLGDLDHYLRGIWLECCGHMSDFYLGGAFSHEIAMTKSIRATFGSAAEITHVYDFGTSSKTLVKVVDTREGKPITKHPVALLCRNHSPEIECIECDKSATDFCIECMYEDGTFGALCAEHAEDHPHDDYGEPVPLLNSPRVGMCGYSGPAEPPY